MKLKLMLALLLSVGGFLLAAAETDNLNVPPSPRIESVKYGDASNWAICESDKRNTDFDVFYVYPTLFADKKRPRMNWCDNPKLRAKTVAFAKAQTGIFGARARVFAPFVRQLDYTRCLSELGSGRDWRISRWLDPGFHDTWAAFQYYLEHLNRGRPYILIGHSQGAMDIYSMMLRTREVAVERGFVAAYLIGLPRLTANDIAADLAPRDIRPATGETDLGVVIVWNTQAPSVDNPFFTGNKTYCINPLNWRTDATPAEKAENVEAFFYDYRNGKCRTVPNFCGARIDTERGALIVDLPVNGEYDAKGFMGQGVFHMNDVWFFAGNILRNAELRVKLWKEKYGGAK
jgi:pimeloyl-ACP methyl ester carboxylesterase